MPYKGVPYWEQETPEEARAGDRLLLRYFRRAAKLQLHRLFVNAAGEHRTGNVVTLDAEALALAPEARALLLDFIRCAARLAPAYP